MTSWDDLTSKREKILDISKQFGAENIRVFGSVARGDDTEDSDIDFLVSMQEGRSYFDLIDFQEELESMLKRKVDVLSDKGLYHLIKGQILSEARPL